MFFRFSKLLTNYGMKKIILQLLKKNYEAIARSWTEKLMLVFEKIPGAQIHAYVEKILALLFELIETNDFTRTDQHLINLYNLFSKAELNLLEISQLFGQGRYSILTYLEKDAPKNTDPVIMLGFLDEIFEELFARYSMLYRDAQVNEISRDRDHLATTLEVNRQYLSNILRTSDHAIMIVDKNENFIEWNEGAEKIFGYSAAEAIGRSSSFTLPHGKKYVDELKQIQYQVAKLGNSIILDTERITKSGKIIFVQLNVSRLPTSDGSYAGRSIIIRDFTEVKKLQQQVDQSEKLAVLGQLSAGIAHEIGNPLASISSIVQLLQRKANDDSTSEYLAILRENIDRISKIVRELVDFSRPPKYEESYVDVTGIIKTAIGIVKYDKRVKNIHFDTQLSTELPNITAVADQLLQVFVNILINALDAMKGEGTISVKSRNDDEFIYVDICDDGCGMDEEVMEKIFEPFFTTKEVGKGTGLGLSVSYGIVKKFNGDIKVTSTVGKGSCFKVILPIGLKKEGE